MAQLSPWVLWPPDGLNLKQGTSGELFGYGYLPLPLTTPKKTTAGKDVPTGNHCWTLFLNTGNFKGPVTFFLPYFWSRPSVENPKLAGLFLDTRPSEPNKAVQMETQHIPAYLAKDAKGDTYARIAPTLFPGKWTGIRASCIASPRTARRPVGRREAWFDGGDPASGRSTPRPPSCTPSRQGRSDLANLSSERPRGEEGAVAWNSFATPVALDEHLRISVGQTGGDENRFEGRPARHPPEYYRLEKDKKGKEEWVVVQPKDVPAETGLAKVEFHRPREDRSEPYVTPDDAKSCWKMLASVRK